MLLIIPRFENHVSIYCTIRPPAVAYFLTAVRENSGVSPPTGDRDTRTSLPFPCREIYPSRLTWDILPFHLSSHGFYPKSKITAGGQDNIIQFGFTALLSETFRQDLGMAAQKRDQYRVRFRLQSSVYKLLLSYPNPNKHNLETDTEGYNREPERRLYAYPLSNRPRGRRADFRIVAHFILLNTSL